MEEIRQDIATVAWTENIILCPEKWFETKLKIIPVSDMAIILKAKSKPA